MYDFWKVVATMRTMQQRVRREATRENMARAIALEKRVDESIKRHKDRIDELEQTALKFGGESASDALKIVTCPVCEANPMYAIMDRCRHCQRRQREENGHGETSCG